MLETIQSVVDIYKNYSGTSVLMLLVLIALLYLWVTHKEKSPLTILLYVVTTLYALFFIPVYSYVVIHFLLEEEVYYRMLWLVPSAMLFAYVSVKALIHAGSVQRRIVTAGMIVGIVAGTGSMVFTDGTYTKAENVYHLPQDVIDVVDIINSGDARIIAAFPPELVQYVRQYSSDVTLCYGREMLVERWGYESPLYDAIAAPILDVWTIQSEARRAYCNCIVLDNRKAIVGDLENEYYLKIATVGNYDIYIDEQTAYEHYNGYLDK
ncbi:MAG: hypothetical protein IKL78_03160 [Lachnospiraceae bacterium]|nr:hypothetical protein [Lachnospiraceae bacterium]